MAGPNRAVALHAIHGASSAGTNDGLVPNRHLGAFVQATFREVLMRVEKGVALARSRCDAIYSACRDSDALIMAQEFVRAGVLARTVRGGIVDQYDLKVRRVLPLKDVRITDTCGIPLPLCTQ